jgi:hypothetical protein
MISLSLSSAGIFESFFRFCCRLLPANWAARITDFTINPTAMLIISMFVVIGVVFYSGKSWEIDSHLGILQWIDMAGKSVIQNTHCRLQP